MVNKPTLNKKAFVISVLRRGSYRWAPRYTALKEANIARNQYRCNICYGIYKRKEVVVDHIAPVIQPQRGFTGWDDYVERMYPDYGGFQVICKIDHSYKTKSENVVRRKTRARKAKAVKS